MVNAPSFDEIQEIEAYRQSMTPEQQAEYVKAAFLEIESDGFRSTVFGIICDKLTRTRQSNRTFTVINGGKA